MPNYRNSTTGTIAANAGVVTLAYRETTNGGVGIQLTGTWSGTLEFRMTIDGTNFVAIQATNVTTGTQATTATANGIYRFDVVGALVVNVTATAWTSGTATLTIVGLGG